MAGALEAHLPTPKPRGCALGFHCIDYVQPLTHLTLRTQTSFKGRVFMTHSTKAIYKMMLEDFVKVSKVGADEENLYDLAELNGAAQTLNPKP